MHAADDALRQIVAEFRTLGEADRRAILSRLRFDERLRFEAVLHPRAQRDDISPELAALVQGDRLTEAARAALSEALADRGAPARHRPTLIDRLLRR